jgi:hypothetical protein
LGTQGHAFGCPKPDVIHASPLCTPHTALQHLGPIKDASPVDKSQITTVMDHLIDYQSRRIALDGTYVPWSIENVPGARSQILERTPHVLLLCGTMFGNRVFRHRIFGSSDPMLSTLKCHHQDKAIPIPSLRLRGLRLSESITNENLTSRPTGRACPRK